MSLPPLEFVYLTEDSIKELKNSNSNFRFPSPAPVLRFLYELCFTMVTMNKFSVMCPRDLPYQKCKGALEAVEFLDCGPEGDVGSYFADIVAQMAQDDTYAGPVLLCLVNIALVLSNWVASLELDTKFSDGSALTVMMHPRKSVLDHAILDFTGTYVDCVTNEFGVGLGIVSKIMQAKWLVESALVPLRFFQERCEEEFLWESEMIKIKAADLKSKESHASQILGFKFQYYQRMEINNPVPTGLYQLTALLVKKDFIDVDSIYSHLLPKDEDAFEHYNAFSAKRLDEVRYRLYGEWERDDERFPMILAARQTARLDTRRILKRLAKENLKQLGRMVAKLAHANPMTVLRNCSSGEAYRDMIAPVVDAFKYLTQLEYDILEYVVIERLAQGGREKLKDDGLNLSDWLQSLASFWGHLLRIADYFWVLRVLIVFWRSWLLELEL
ncbi:UNVERIFIED_CONTAM: THO complex subunit [Sesamum latifolium]|uniref:THO complex subunit n=1 Tax=Sesamum latifolium TaxID=2727402 RepID=A0AAW2X357_9LAMI